jgi:O-antigen/teichoic acid export membrane protein
MRQNLKTDVALAASSDVVRKLLGYVVLATLARALSKTDMGELFFAMTFASVFAMLTELGTSRYLTRRVAQSPERALDHLAEVLSLRVPAIAIAFVLLSGIGWILMPERAHILLPISVFVLLGDLYYSFASLLVGLRRLGYRFLTGLIDVVLLVGLVLLAVRLGWNLSGVLLCYVISSVTLVAVTALVVRWRFGPYRLVLDRARLRRVASESFPFFLLVFLALAYSKVDTLMIFFIRSADEVARYEAGYKFYEISRFAVRPTGMVFFPLCASLVATNEWSGFRSVAWKLLLGAAASGMVVAIGVIAVAATFVPAVWGKAYDTSIPIVRVLFLGLPPLYVSYVSTFLAQAMNLEGRVAATMAGALVLNVALNAALIPSWGAVGAAWATVVAESLLAMALLTLVVRQARRSRRAAPATVGAA